MARPSGDESQPPTESIMNPHVGQSYDENSSATSIQHIQGGLTLPPIRSLDLALAHPTTHAEDALSQTGLSQPGHHGDDGGRALTPLNRRDGFPQWRSYPPHSDSGSVQYSAPTSGQRDAPQMYSRSYQHGHTQAAFGTVPGRDQEHAEGPPGSSYSHIVSHVQESPPQPATHSQTSHPVEDTYPEARPPVPGARSDAPEILSSEAPSASGDSPVHFRSYSDSVHHNQRNDFRAPYTSPAQSFHPMNLQQSPQHNTHSTPHNHPRPTFSQSYSPPGTYPTHPPALPYSDYPTHSGEASTSFARSSQSYGPAPSSPESYIGSSSSSLPRQNPEVLYRYNSYEQQSSGSSSRLSPRPAVNDARRDRWRDPDREPTRERTGSRSPVVRQTSQPSQVPRAQTNTSSRPQYRDVAQMSASVTEIIEHCTALTAFARHYASLKREGREGQPVFPSASELSQMVHRATLVAQLLDALRVARQNEENAAPDVPIPPTGSKRSWDVALEDTQAPPLRLIFETGQGARGSESGSVQEEAIVPLAADASSSRYSRTKAEQDMELIKRKRHTNADNESESPVIPRAKKRGPRQKVTAPVPGQCNSCGSRDTPEWRRGPDGPRTLCNACGLHYAKVVREGGEFTTESDVEGSDSRSRPLIGRSNPHTTPDVKPDIISDVRPVSTSLRQISLPVGLRPNMPGNRSRAQAYSSPLAGPSMSAGPNPYPSSSSMSRGNQLLSPKQ